MPKYAQFNPDALSPQPITGWYDTDFFTYTNLPAENALIELTDDEWAGRLVDPSAWVNNNGSLAAATPPAPSVADQAFALLAAGLTITSTDTPALSGTYACDADTQSHIQAEMIAILANGVFADGGSTVDWPDIEGASHTFSLAGFRTLASAVGIFAATLLRIMRTNAGSLPAVTATIP